MTLQPSTESQSRTMRLLAVLLVALLTPLALTGAAVSPADHHHHPQHTTWNVLVGNESKDRAIQGTKFLPADIWIDAGDSVHWTANSALIHTVTFLAKDQTLASVQPFNPLDRHLTEPAGGPVYNGRSFYSSGTLGNDGSPGFGLTIRHDYQLKFPRAGNYDYYCLVHGQMMKGTVHVQREGSPYPYTQQQYDKQAADTSAAILASGYRLWRDTAKQATNRHVFEGADNDMVMVMRFIRPVVHVRVGETVTWSNIGTGPHTVTFGTEPADVFAPSGDPRHYRGGDLNSGLQLPGSSFTVRFEKAGTYDYICALHDNLGMVGTVVVIGHHDHH